MSNHPSIIPGRSNFEYEAVGLPKNESVWIKVGEFDVSIELTDEGIALDVFDYDDVDREESMASCYAFQADRPSVEH